MMHYDITINVMDGNGRFYKAAMDVPHSVSTYSLECWAKLIMPSLTGVLIDSIVIDDADHHVVTFGKDDEWLGHHNDIVRHRGEILRSMHAKH